MAYKSWATGDILTAADLNSSLDSAGWTAFTTSITNMNLGTGGGYTARYAQIGKTIIVEIYCAIGTSASITGTPVFTVPSGKDIKTTTYNLGFGSIYNAATTYPTIVTSNGASSMAMYIQNASGTYLTWASPGGVFTLASGNHVSFRAIYETV